MEAKIIVQGEVKSVKSYKGINDIIYTRASVLVSDVFKGKIAKKNITVEYRGGEVGNVGLSVEDEPSLEKGERVLLFLTNSFWRKNVYYVVKGVSGKYAICSDDTVRVGSSAMKTKQPPTKKNWKFRAKKPAILKLQAISVRKPNSG